MIHNKIAMGPKPGAANRGVAVPICNGMSLTPPATAKRHDLQGGGWMRCCQNYSGERFDDDNDV